MKKTLRTSPQPWCNRRVPTYSKNGKRIGRPSLWSPTLTRAILRLLRQGQYIETAALVSGISKDTLYERLKKDRPFAAAVEKATAEWEAGDVAGIAKAAERTWQARAWRLERKIPQRYGRRTVISGDGPGGSIPLSFEVHYHPLSARPDTNGQKRQALSPASGHKRTLATPSPTRTDGESET